MALDLAKIAKPLQGRRVTILTSTHTGSYGFIKT